MTKLCDLERELIKLKKRVDVLEHRNFQFAALIAIEAAKLNMSPEELVIQAVNYFIKKFGNK